MGWLLLLGCVGWLMAIAEGKRFRAERDLRRQDAETYKAAIRDLSQQLFARDIRRAHRDEPGTTIVPADAWIARGSETRH